MVRVAAISSVIIMAGGLNCFGLPKSIKQSSLYSGVFGDSNSFTESEVKALSSPKGKESISSFERLANLVTPGVTRQLHNIPFAEEPILLDKPRNIKQHTHKELLENYTNGMIGYCHERVVGGQVCICEETYPEYEIVEDNSVDVSVTIAINQKLKKIVVAYRPSLTLTNWIDNTNYNLVDALGMPRGVKVHRGFYNAHLATYYGVKDAIEKFIADPKYKSYPLFVSGGSLGGALSQVSLTSWVNLLKEKNDTRPIENISYFGPRAGNRAFAEHFDTLKVTASRYSNFNDAVSHLPPRSFGFVHTGAEIHMPHIPYGSEPILKDCSLMYDEDPECGFRTHKYPSMSRHFLPFGKMVLLPPYC